MARVAVIRTENHRFSTSEEVTVRKNVKDYHELQHPLGRCKAGLAKVLVPLKYTEGKKNWFVPTCKPQVTMCYHLQHPCLRIMWSNYKNKYELHKTKSYILSRYKILWGAAFIAILSHISPQAVGWTSMWGCLPTVPFFWWFSPSTVTVSYCSLVLASLSGALDCLLLAADSQFQKNQQNGKGQLVCKHGRPQFTFALVFR